MAQSTGQRAGPADSVTERIGALGIDLSTRVFVRYLSSKASVAKSKKESMSFDYEEKSKRRAQAVTSRQRYDDLRDVVLRTMSAYVAIKSYPVVTAAPISPDPSENRNNKWRPNLANFVCDVELSTTKALEGDSNLDLQAAWFELAQGNELDPEVERELVNRVGKIYAARGIDPPVYFRRKVTHGGSR